MNTKKNHLQIAQDAFAHNGLLVSKEVLLPQLKILRIRYAEAIKTKKATMFGKFCEGVSAVSPEVQLVRARINACHLDQK